MAQRPNRVILDLEPWQRKDLDWLVEADQTTRASLIRQALSEFFARKKADCAECKRYDWIAGYTEGKPLCGKCM